MHVVIGAGMGGLAAATALARAGREVLVLEARDGPGGLAGPVHAGGLAFDGGPYILLDRPGLAWAFAQLGEALEDHVDLIRLDEVVRVRTPGGTVSLYDDRQRTAEAFEARWPGSARRYLRFVEEMVGAYEALAPLQRGPTPRPWRLLRGGRWRHAPLLLRSLGQVLGRTGLPEPVVQALGIWTHIAGQRIEAAPSPLAFVPAIVHTAGAWTVRGGIHRVPLALEALARRHGVTFRYGTRVERILRRGRRVVGVVVDGQLIRAEHVVSDAPGIATCTRLVEPPDPALARQLEALPLQSPGVAAYLKVAGIASDTPFLEFQLPGGEPAPGRGRLGCPPAPQSEAEWGSPKGSLPSGGRGVVGDLVRLRIAPGAVDPEREGQARFLSPVDHAWAERAGADGQRAHLQRLLAEPWWSEALAEPEVVATRIPVEWGRRYHLHRDSMNPVMTAAFMRRGRMPHRGLLADNLTLVGSATHPGQWVSFCAISGVVAVRGAL